jgi:hypothetical protein
VTKYLEKLERLPEKIRERIELTSTCWNWSGAPNCNGYGRRGISKKKELLAHRLMYELLVGPIPPGLTLDHICRNRMCVNPAHLEPVTNKVNILRGESPAAKNARKTHCPKGHLFDETNTLWERQRSGALGRKCKTCKYEYHHGWYQRNKGQAREYSREYKRARRLQRKPKL